MKKMAICFGLAALVMGLTPGALAEEPAAAKSDEKILFDFENASDLVAWASVDMNAVLSNQWQAASAAAAKAGKPVPPKPAARKAEPAPTFELASGGAVSGKQALKITFHGGSWPAAGATVGTNDLAWAPYRSVKVDITAPRACLAGIRFRWEGASFDKTAFLKQGRNTIATGMFSANQRRFFDAPPEKPVTFEIFMYNPHEGESLLVDSVRLAAAEAPAPGGDYMGGKPQFNVLGTNLVVSDVSDLGRKLKGQWVQQKCRTVDQVESEFRARYEELKKTHPKAVLAVFRDGEKGYDPGAPDKEYKGWKEAYVNSHGPDGNLEGRAARSGAREATELFMRHRSRLMQVDFTSIPAGSTILASGLILTAGNSITAAELATNEYAGAVKKPNMWVAEPCNREWDDGEVNAYQYAKDKFWKGVGGTYYGDDPDFLPVFIAYGPAAGNVNAWDFTEAVKFLTDGAHVNHGFFWHGDGGFYWHPGMTHLAKDVKSRPAVLVIYEPKK